MEDYIIVGCGLAGVHIAHELDKRQLSYTVFDNSEIAASVIAGGVINPLILKRFTKAWQADVFIPTAVKTYRELEQKLNCSLIEAKPIYRKIKTVGEQNDWFTAADKPSLQAYMNPKLQELDSLPNAYKFGEVLQSYQVNTSKLITAYQQKLRNDHQLIADNFDYAALNIYKHHVEYKGLQARKIIFCEGYGTLKNPYFNNLPLIGNKGEYLIAKIPDLHTEVIVKTALALIPLGNAYYKFGASYNRDFTSLDSEEDKREFLIKKLEEIINLPYSIESIDVGVRPTVLDRRPLLGQHKTHPQLLICNGFGSHGIMMAAQLTQWLIAFDQDHNPLPKVVNVQRYPKK